MVFLVWILSLLVTNWTKADYVVGTDAVHTTDSFSTRLPSKISVSGRLIINRHTGVHHSRHRHDVTSTSSTNPKHNASLHLDDGSSPLYMEVGPGSVWGPRSILQARWGRHRLRFKVPKQKGHIYLPDHHLKLDKATGMAMSIPEVMIEVALFADAKYMAHLYDLGYNTTWKALGWFITKWNVIQGVYTNTKKTGALVRFKLVKIELWWFDPAGYPSPTADEASRLNWFCRNTPQGDGADQKILYTLHTGSTQYNGWSYVGKTCVDQQNCYLVKSPTLGASEELHEMGHSIGILHDNQMEGCTPPQGFMGPGLNYLFKICYRTALQKSLRELDCLHRKDFVDREHIASLPYWLGSPVFSPIQT